MILDSAGIVVNKLHFSKKKSNLLMLERNEHKVFEAKARTIGAFAQQIEWLYRIGLLYTASKQ
jgi:hypothetical protein